MTKNLLTEEIKNYTSGGEDTSREILGQPELWLKTWAAVNNNKPGIISFFSRAKSNKNLHIILTGAGSSAFIGDVLEGPFQRETGIVTKAVATTDIVTHPELYFQKSKDVLLVSFARSGNSPESAKAVELAGQLCRSAMNFVITCNNESSLIETAKDSDNLILVLPPEADDKGLAMTGSFTSMLLAGLLSAHIDNLDKTRAYVKQLSIYADNIFNSYISALKQVSEIDFNRGVFLGSGLMKGIARESQLKLQELTDGNIVCKYDSLLGFRHGPKAVLNENSLITILFSNNTYVNKYEADLIEAIKNGRKPAFSIGVMENKIESVELDLEIIAGGGGEKLPEEFLAVAAVLPAQILAFYKSVKEGLNPDNPSESGMIHRVVQGVNIYPYEK